MRLNRSLRSTLVFMRGATAPLSPPGGVVLLVPSTGLHLVPSTGLHLVPSTGHLVPSLLVPSTGHLVPSTGLLLVPTTGHLVPSTGLSWFLLQVTWFLLQVSPGSFYRSLLVPSTGLSWVLLQVIKLQLSNQVSRRVESVEVLIKQSAPSRGGGGANRSPNHPVP
ncbi:unnamed protein product [Arctogadus glacialis]